MRLRARSLPHFAVALAVALLLVSAPLHADEPAPEAPAADAPAEGAPVPEQGIFTGADIDSGVGKAFDVVILRPLGLVGMGVGAVLFLPAAAFSVFDEGAFEECFELFLKVPYENAITRPLGDF